MLEILSYRDDVSFSLFQYSFPDMKRGGVHAHNHSTTIKIKKQLTLLNFYLRLRPLLFTPFIHGNSFAHLLSPLRHLVEISNHTSTNELWILPHQTALLLVNSSPILLVTGQNPWSYPSRRLLFQTLDPINQDILLDSLPNDIQGSDWGLLTTSLPGPIFALQPSVLNAAAMVIRLKLQSDNIILI